MSSKKDSDSKTNDIVFSGKRVEDWFKFDRQVLRYVRKKYGKVGEQLWLETATAIDENSVSAIAQDTYSDLVNREGFKEAKEYWNWDHFWSVSYQDSCRARIYSGIRDYVEERTEGRAFQHMVELETSALPKLRSGMQYKFAKATPQVVRRMELEYEAGLPDKPGAVVFPEGCDIELKLEKLEDRKRTLWYLCPEALRKDYEFGREPKLVRIVLTHLSSEYRPDVNRMLDMHKLQLQIAGKPVPAGMEIEGYDDEWLPTWKMLRETLLKTSEALGNNAESATAALPTMFTAGSCDTAKHGKGSKGLQCFRCGEYGHRSTDPECKGKPGDVHACAPPGFGKRGRSNSSNNRGSSGGRGRGKGAGKGRKVCVHFQQHGNCRYGQNCRFDHERSNSSDSNGHAGIVNSVMSTIQDRIKSLSGKQKQKQKRRRDSHSNSSSDSEESDGGSASRGNEPNALLDLLTAATKPVKRKGKKNRRGGGALGMTVLSGSSSKSSSSTSNSIDGGGVRCMAELHSEGVVGWDTDASRMVTTNAQFMIPGLLDRSEEAVQSISFNSAAGNTGVLGIGPAARATIDTEDGKPHWIIEPNAVLLDSSRNGNDMTVYSAQSMKKLGLCMQQCYKGTDRDVLVCRKSGRVVDLSEENGILVLRTMRRQATDLGRVRNIEVLVQDIASGLVSPLVPCSVKNYQRSSGSNSSRPLTVHAQLAEASGKGKRSIN